MRLFKSRDEYLAYKSTFRVDNKPVCKKGKPCGDICIPRKYNCNPNKNNKPRLSSSVTKREFNKLVNYERKVNRKTKQDAKIKSLILASTFTITGMYYGACIYSQIDLNRKLRETRPTNDQKPTFKNKPEEIESFFNDEVKRVSDIENQWFKDYWWTVGGLDHAVIEKNLRNYKASVNNTKNQFLRDKEAHDFYSKFRTEEQRSWDGYKQVDINFEKEFGAKSWTDALKIKPEDLPKDPKERMKYIKKQYSRLAKEAHPDLNPNNPNAENEMKALNRLMDWIEANQNNLF